MTETYNQFDNLDKKAIIPDIKFRNYSFRIREVILAIVAVVALIICVILGALLAKTKDENVQASPLTGQQCAKVCNSPGCLESASYIIKNMNASIDPCVDFYSYSCGNFAKHNTLNPEISQRDVYWNLYYENEDKLEKILEEPVTRDTDWSAERKVKDFFLSCTDHWGRMSNGGRPFIEQIVSKMGGWYVLDTFNSTTWDFNTALKTGHVDFWTNILFSFYIGPDWYDWKKRVIQVSLWICMLYKTSKFSC